MRFLKPRQKTRCFYILKIRNAARSGKALRTYAAALHQSAARPRRASDGASASPAQLRPGWCSASDCPPLLPQGRTSQNVVFCSARPGPLPRSSCYALPGTKRTFCKIRVRRGNPPAFLSQLPGQPTEAPARAAARVPPILSAQALRARYGAAIPRHEIFCQGRSRRSGAAQP